jgi:hypothetical protein
VDKNEVQALADSIYAERYEHRVLQAGREKNPGAWVACFHLRRRAYQEANETLIGATHRDDGKRPT